MKHSQQKGFTLLPFGTARSKRGFTLLELLIVIAILAILSAVTIIVINPAEILRRARDSQRVSDLATMKTSIGYYLVSTGTPDLDFPQNRCFGTGQAIRTFSHVANVAATSAPAATTTGFAIDGTGWVPVRLSELTGGSPISGWPIDPNRSVATASGDNARYYAYMCNNDDLTFTFFGNMESSFYKNGGPGDVESTDGGVTAMNGVLEVGTTVSLATGTATAFYYGN